MGMKTGSWDNRMRQAAIFIHASPIFIADPQSLLGPLNIDTHSGGKLNPLREFISPACLYCTLRGVFPVQLRLTSGGNDGRRFTRYLGLLLWYPRRSGVHRKQALASGLRSIGLGGQGGPRLDHGATSNFHGHLTLEMMHGGPIGKRYLGHPNSSSIY